MKLPEPSESSHLCWSLQSIKHNPPRCYTYTLCKTSSNLERRCPNMCLKLSCLNVNWHNRNVSNSDRLPWYVLIIHAYVYMLARLQLQTLVCFLTKLICWKIKTCPIKGIILVDFLEKRALNKDLSLLNIIIFLCWEISLLKVNRYHCHTIVLYHEITQLT